MTISLIGQSRLNLSKDVRRHDVIQRKTLRKAFLEAGLVGMIDLLRDTTKTRTTEKIQLWCNDVESIMSDCIRFI